MDCRLELILIDLFEYRQKFEVLLDGFKVTEVFSLVQLKFSDKLGKS